ncbi:GspH/FimT family pseudopilin [Pontibacterium granulatum]|uniref:GspH/FimT family pseudopilin n=1 Tax=Pontibacterium granulatum TaxID=2036029 RepID=UPI00249B04BD|nr:GspH/FimT family pseudopilin [Pontibacterium granulatum]MDI3325250.1 GspH/FimT family pseudopilin [Pontibacterium granulatum]
MHKDVCRPAGRGVASVWGFSLIELLVTLSILIILLSVAVPGFSGLVVDARVSETQNRLRAALALARSEAVRQNQRITLCASRDATSCVGGARTGGSVWSQALLFEDADGNRLYDPDIDSLIKLVNLGEGGKVVWNRGDSTVYEGDGSLLGGSNGSFYVFDDADKSLGVKLVLQMTGRVRQVEFSESDVAKLDQYLGQ